jgi:hypothetical protein
MTERRSSFAQAGDSFADRARSAREYRRRSKQAGIAGSSDNLQLFGYAGGQYGETLHFICVARNEAAAVTVQMGKRPKPIHALARKSTRRLQRNPGGEPE